MSSPVIIWFRQDLRLRDHPALTHAVKTGQPVLPVYVLDDKTAGPWVMGGASRWWLHHSLESLQKELARRNLPLILRRGDAATIIPALVQELHAQAVYWNRCYEPFHIRRDKKLKEALQQQGITAESFNGSLLFEPWEIQNKQGHYFKVFTPFWKTCLQARDPGAALPLPRFSGYEGDTPSSDQLDEWGLLPTTPDWAGGLRRTWQPGEKGAENQVKHFTNKTIVRYKDERDHPASEATSRLSPYLHHGELSPRQIWRLLQQAREEESANRNLTASIEKFLSELGWREFSYHLLYHFPDLPEKPFRPEFAEFPWCEDREALRAWQQGKTGIPIIDAGMRELWETGYMHNRVRMIVASFLTKNLLIPWQEGEGWFWDTLVDADLANNSASWQWVAGCGADAAPYFRIFNPVLQAKKFDPDGKYLRRWVPELAEAGPNLLHEPWKDKAFLKTSGYPAPIVDLKASRERALEAYKKIKKQDGHRFPVSQ